MKACEPLSHRGSMSKRNVGDPSPLSPLPLERIAREALLPRLVGFRAVSPSLFDWHLQPSVLVYREPVEDVLVGIHMVALGDVEFGAHYAAMPLIAPTYDPGFQAVGMERHRIKSLLGNQRWLPDGRRDDRVIELFVSDVVEEGLPLLRRLAEPETFADRDRWRAAV